MTDPTFNVNGHPVPVTKRRVDLDGPDFYPTPAWAVRALIANERFDGEIWEPACGDGAMAEVLKLTGQPIIASDLYVRGYGQPGLDFLNATRRANNIVTNPPYHSAEGFAATGLRLAHKKLALLRANRVALA